jgi:tetratricopeptide (TPR) repeat protein
LSIKKVLGSNRSVFIITSTIALVIRIVHLVYMSDNPLFARPIMDAAVHDTWAKGLINGTWPLSEPFFRAPLYPYFLGFLYKIFDASRFPVQMIHVLVSACGAGLAGLSATKLWGNRAGYFAGILMACFWVSIWFSAELLIVSLAVTLNLLLIWLLLSDKKPSWQKLLLTGFVFGLSAIARPNILIIAPVIIWYYCKQFSFKSQLLIFLAGLLIPIIPVTTSNLIRGNDFVPIASQGGVNFFIGNNIDSDGRTAVVPGTRATWQGGRDDSIMMAEKSVGKRLKPSEVDRWFFIQGLKYLVNEPVDAIKLYGHKLKMILGEGERSNNKFIYQWREWSPLLRLQIWPGWTVILGFGVIGLFSRGRDSRNTFLFLTIILYSLSILLFFVNARFRLPLAAMLIIPAGAGLDAVWIAIKNRKWVLPKKSLIIASILTAFALFDLQGFAENRIDANPFHHFTLGNAWADAGEDFKAISEYRFAIAADEKYRQQNFYMIGDALYSSLGGLLIKTRQQTQLMPLYKKWVQRLPESMEARVSLGEALLQSGDIDAASVQFEIMLRQAPKDTRAGIGYAWVMYHNKEFGSALRKFQMLNRKTPDATVLFGAGLCLIELGRLEESIPVFQEVIKMQPAYWQAWGNMAGVFERLGDLDHAANAYINLLKIKSGDQRAEQWLSAHGL